MRLRDWLIEQRDLQYMHRDAAIEQIDPGNVRPITARYDAAGFMLDKVYEKLCVCPFDDYIALEEDYHLLKAAPIMLQVCKRTLEWLDDKTAPAELICMLKHAVDVAESQERSWDTHRQ